MRKKVIAMLLALVLIIAAFPTAALAKDQLKNTDPERYYIWLDTKNQIVTVYERDENGEYTKIVRQFLCTSGRTQKKIDPETGEVMIDPKTGKPDAGTPTPAGTWKIGSRERFGKFASFGGEYARYWTQIVGGVYFHSAMFSARDVDHFKRGAWSGLGSAGSHGCVRLYVEDAKWLYYYACPGTTVEVTTGGESRNDLKKALRTELSFDLYNEMQKNIYDNPEEPNRHAWVVVDGAALRTGNGSNDSIIKKLPEGAEVEVLQEGDPWAKVLADGKEGYIKRGYLTYTQGVLETTPEADVIEDTVHMYTGPSEDSTKICKVPHDTVVRVLEVDEEAGWTKIQYWASIGYVRNDWLVKDWGVITTQWEELGVVGHEDMQVSPAKK